MMGMKKKRRSTTAGGPRRKIDRKAAQRAFWFFCGLIGVLLVAWVVAGPGGFLDYRASKKELAELRTKSAELERDNEALRGEIERLKTDERYIEEVARQKYGMLKKDERVYEFERKKGK